MRKEVYEKIREKLVEIGENEIAHIDMWNRNVDFIEQETAWERPAVFIEFEPVQWISIVPGVQYRTEAKVRLHIVTDWKAQETNVFELPEKIHRALAGLEGESFTDFTLSESHTNHNHEEIIESVEVYSFVAFLNMGS
ncbi:MAG: hypothetical protein J1E95_04335 [Muribaculaceae bacterium]|nr:hypothetical protein [Muribaculaceae bacterium]